MLGEGLPAASGCVECETAPEAEGDEDDEGAEEGDEEKEGAVADGLCAAEVPGTAGQDDGEGPEGASGAGGE